MTIECAWRLECPGFRNSRIGPWSWPFPTRLAGGLQYRGGVDAPTKTHDACPGREIAVGTAALFVETQDEVVQLRGPQQGQLALQIRGGPEADHLDEKLPARIEAVAQQKIGKDDGCLRARTGSGSRRRSQSGAAFLRSRAKRASSLLSKGLGVLAGKSGSPLCRCSSPSWPRSMQVARSSKRAHQARKGKQLAQGPAVKQGASKDCIRPGEIQDRRIPVFDCADEAAQLGLANHGRSAPSARMRTRLARKSRLRAIR